MRHWLWAILFATVGCSTKPSQKPRQSEPPKAVLPDAISTIVPEHRCPALDGTKPVESADGLRRLALLIGVGDYADERHNDLKGPPSDAKAMFHVLTSSAGYAFPKENVCVLTDSEATMEGVKKAFEAALIQPMRKGDVAVFFYAGHGSQTVDRDGDEVDGRDETFVLHDSGMADTQLNDDVFARWVGRLHEKGAVDSVHGANITLIFDSCNSGTASRGETGEEPDVTRFSPSDLDVSDVITEVREHSAMAGAWLGVVQVSAATDGTAAQEPAAGGLGRLTSALVEHLSATPGPTPLTWAQIRRTVPADVARRTSNTQRPRVAGALDKVVFGVKNRARPLGWDISADLGGGKYEIRGLPMPGWAKGAKLSVYPGGASLADLKAGLPIKATVQIAEFAQVSAKVNIVAGSGLSRGDLVVLATPATKKFKIRLREGGSADALDPKQVKALKAALSAHREAKLLLELTHAPKKRRRKKKIPQPKFVLAFDRLAKTINILGPERLPSLRDKRVTRNRVPIEANGWATTVIHLLTNHALQSVLLDRKGESQGVYENNSTLEVQVVRDDDNRTSARTGWRQACANERQTIPLCNSWRIKITNRHPSKSLSVGGAILWNDGSIDPIFKRDVLSGEITLEPRSSKVIDRLFETRPPLYALDHILVWGVDPTKPTINWHRYERTETLPKLRGKAPHGDTELANSLNELFGLAVRGGGSRRTANLPDPWTSSHVELRAAGNLPFDSADAEDLRCAADKREPTIDLRSNKFDITEYMPADPESKTYKMLQIMHWLATDADPSKEDGIRYCQHWWIQKTDADNLEHGIDCSHAVWFAFTRAGMKYNSIKKKHPLGRQINTARMWGPKTMMKEEFVDCCKKRVGSKCIVDDDSLELGDVLVYHKSNKPFTGGQGHVVMALDPKRKIIWGSHGSDSDTFNRKKKTELRCVQNKDGSVSDGSRRSARKGDPGVEYQKMVKGGGWHGFSSRKNALRACWRHKALIAERNAGRGIPAGPAANICEKPDDGTGPIGSPTWRR